MAELHQKKKKKKQEWERERDRAKKGQEKKSGNNKKAQPVKILSWTVSEGFEHDLHGTISQISEELLPPHGELGDLT